MNIFFMSPLFLLFSTLFLTAASLASETAQEIFQKYSPHIVYVENKFGGMGTGFLIRPNSIITNRHVVFGYDPVLNKWNAPKKFTFRDGNTTETYEHIFCSTRVDICFITFKEKKSFLSQPSFATRPVKAGEDLIVIGHPAGILVPIITEGIASSELSKMPETDIQNKSTSYLGFTTNAAISKGSSGSPVISKTGEILGIAVGILNDSQNINFVISSTEVLATLDNLIRRNGKEAFTFDFGFEIELDKKMEKAVSESEGQNNNKQSSIPPADLQEKAEASPVIRSILTDNIHRFKACYEKMMIETGSDVRGVLILDFVIGSKGTVIQAKANSESPLPDTVSRCVITALREVHFPAPMGGGVIEVRQPFNFYPKKI